MLKYVCMIALGCCLTVNATEEMPTAKEKRLLFKEKQAEIVLNEVQTEELAVEEDEALLESLIAMEEEDMGEMFLEEEFDSVIVKEICDQEEMLNEKPENIT